MRSLLLSLASLVLLGGAAVAGNRPNVLFIAVDDLRPQLNCYGERQMQSPNIDALAARGTLFTRAYCMVPTCGASRASMMTGIRPSPRRFVNYLAWAERDAPGIPTINTWFRQAGYYTISLGKVFHHAADHREGWSEPAWRPSGVPWYRDPQNAALHAKLQRQKPARRGPPFESYPVDDNAYADGVIAEKAITTLEQLSRRSEPFFLAVGFLKPHLPFVAPKKYWDLYDFHEIRLPENYYTPKNAPPESLHQSGELRAYAGVPPRGKVPDEMARRLIHGYYACVSYTDAQIGKVLHTLDKLGLAENTIVVLWGDHGWNLGEHTLWCKHCCYETSMRIPLIVAAPNLPSGQRCSALIESIDLFPTLCELAGLPIPEHCQGQSFVAQLRDASAPGKTAAVGRFQRGDTIRTDHYRLAEYRNRDGTPTANMLYDHRNDPGENQNVSSLADYAADVDRLTQLLHQQMGRDSEFSPPKRDRKSER